MPRDGSDNWSYLPGTEAQPGTTIASAPYNANLADIQDNEFNVPRPISKGGTGATNVNDAMVNLAGGPVATLTLDQTWTGAQKSGTGTVLVSAAVVTPTLLAWEGNRASLTLANNVLLANPSDIALSVGYVGRIIGAQNGTGGFTLGFGSSWFPIGRSTIPPVPPGANAKWRIDFEVATATRIDFTLSSVGV